MVTLIRAELRDSWPGWLGVLLGFVMASFGLALATLVLQSGLAAPAAGVPEMEAQTYAYQGGINLALSLVVALTVVSAATNLVVDSRRGAVARLALAGATPAEVVAAIGAQLSLVAVVSALLGDLLAVASLRGVLAFLMAERGAESAGIPSPPVVEPATLAAVNAAWVLVVLVAGFGQAVRASRIGPVEALRQAQSAAVVRQPRLGRWLRAAIALFVIVGTFLLVPALAADRNPETFTQIMQTNLMLLCVTGWFLAEVGPVLVGPLTALWTRLGPMRSPAWQIARATVLARSERLTRSVTPVMFTVGLAFGVIGLPGVYNATFAASGIDVRLEHIGADTFLLMLGLPLLIALCGSVGSLFMMSRQRQAELALLGIAGATARQQTATATLEAVIVTGTAAILGLVMAVVSLGHIVAGIAAIGMVFAFAVPVLPLLGALGVAGLVTVAATVLPTLPAQRLPAPRVIARLIAD
ncbi:MAG: hypothetical protein KDB60_01085 [Propionibacteriaceae bacterium]|nr:hypothetical protein [Propionibacteriaceae bacterium]